MIKIKIPVLEVTKPKILKPNEQATQQITITEEACKKIVENFKDPMPIVMGNVPIGLVLAIEYDVTKQKVYAELELYLSGVAGMDPDKLDFLEFPNGGKQLLNGELVGVNLMPHLDLFNAKIKEINDKKQVENNEQKKEESDN